MFAGVNLAYWLTLHSLVTAVAVLFYVIASHVNHQRRHPSAAIAWVLFILLVPYLALPAFLTFGSRKLPRPRAAAVPSSVENETATPWAIQTILALGQPAPAAYHDLNVHVDGDAALQALWRTIDEARQSIDLCTFLIGRDKIGEAVIARLAVKARAGVKVRLLLDGLGSLMAGRPQFRSLTEAGGEFRLFVPPLHSPLKGRTNLRDHRKMLIADRGQVSQRLWCGGRNLAAEYFGGQPGKTAWRDLSFDLRGEVVDQANAMFARDWSFADGNRMSPSEQQAGELAWPAHGAQLIASGPDQIDDTVYSVLVTAAYRSRRRIALMTPYFVPDAALMIALCLAARRGVAVDLVVPARSNHRLSDLARARALRTLVAAGGRVWLAPHMLHAKLTVVDDVLALAGSANLDSRSLFLNYELMMAFHDPVDVARFSAWFERERAEARLGAPKAPGLLRDVAEGLVLWVGFQL